MTTVKLDTSQLKQAVYVAAEGYLVSEGVPACEAAAKVLETTYRDILLRHAVKPGGPNFIHAWQAVDSKVGVFDNHQGVYLVMGSRRKGGQRVAPQILWGEFGTGERKTKNEEYRGVMPPQGWLADAIAQGMQDAKEAMKRVLARNRK